MTPELAIVIPAYNEQKLIGDCIAAVVKEVKRSGVNAEIVVVDNNSKDRTGEIARSFEGVKHGRRVVAMKDPAGKVVDHRL